MKRITCIVSLVVLVMGMFGSYCSAQQRLSEQQQRALRDLQQMRARGEVSQEDYQQMVKAIRGQAVPPGAGAGMPQTGGVVKNDNWGFTVTAPAGWMAQVDGQGAVILNPAVQGMVMVTHHACKTVEELTTQMRNPNSDGATRPGIPELKPVGEIKRFGSRGVIAQYVDATGRTPYRTKVVGIVGPAGGGPFVFTLSEDKQVSPQLDSAFKAIVRSVRYLERPQP